MQKPGTLTKKVEVLYPDRYDASGNRTPTLIQTLPGLEQNMSTCAGTLATYSTLMGFTRCGSEAVDILKRISQVGGAELAGEAALLLEKIQKNPLQHPSAAGSPANDTAPTVVADEAVESIIFNAQENVAGSLVENGLEPDDDHQAAVNLVRLIHYC